MVSAKSNWVTMAVMLFLACMAITFGGIVFAQGSVPISGATVFASGPNGLGYAVTDSGGRYTIADGLGTGSYSVTIIMASGYLDAEVKNVAVVAGQETSGKNFFLKRSGVIKGKVTSSGGSPIKGIVVYATKTSGTGGNVSSYAFTATDGSYVISSGLSTGTYNVTAGFGYGLAGETVGYLSKTVSGVTIAGVQEVSNVNFQLDLSGSISGKVTTSAGIPLANVGVSAY